MSLVVLAAYVGLSAVLFGRGVLGSPGDRVVGDQGSDKTISMWALSWWPHMLGEGKDPFSADPVLRGLTGEEGTREAETMLPAFLAEHAVDAIVVAPGTRAGPRRLVNTLGIKPAREADSLVYALRPPDGK